MKNERLQQLAHRIFIATKDGEEFLKLLKEYEENLPVFPVDPSILQRHGDANGWANYRAGRKYLISYVSELARTYDLRMDAINKGKNV